MPAFGRCLRRRRPFFVREALITQSLVRAMYVCCRYVYYPREFFATILYIDAHDGRVLLCYYSHIISSFLMSTHEDSLFLSQHVLRTSGVERPSSVRWGTYLVVLAPTWF